MNVSNFIETRSRRRRKKGKIPRPLEISPLCSSFFLCHLFSFSFCSDRSDYRSNNRRGVTSLTAPRTPAFVINGLTREWLAACPRLRISILELIGPRIPFSSPPTLSFTTPFSIDVAVPVALVRASFRFREPFSLARHPRGELKQRGSILETFGPSHSHRSLRSPTGSSFCRQVLLFMDKEQIGRITKDVFFFSFRSETGIQNVPKPSAINLTSFSKEMLSSYARSEEDITNF